MFQRKPQCGVLFGALPLKLFELGRQLTSVWGKLHLGTSAMDDMHQQPTAAKLAPRDCSQRTTIFLSASKAYRISKYFLGMHAAFDKLVN